MPDASILNDVGAVLESVADRAGSADVLDRPAETLAALAGRLPAGTRRFLSGEWLGHPLHPALVAAPIGFLSAATVLDLVREADAARKLLGAGLLAALPTALSGWSDWLETSGPARRVGTVHLALNSAALSLYAQSYLHRRRGQQGKAAVVALAGAAALGVGGWLGGHLAYSLGVGVDTEAVQSGRGR